MLFAPGNTEIKIRMKVSQRFDFDFLVGWAIRTTVSAAKLQNKEGLVMLNT